MLLNFIFCLFLFGVYFIIFRIEFLLRKKINFFLKFDTILISLCLLMTLFAPLLFIFLVKNSIIAVNFFQNVYELFFQHLFLGFERILSKYQQSSGDMERVKMLRQLWDTLYFIAYSFFGKCCFSPFSFIRI